MKLEGRVHSSHPSLFYFIYFFSRQETWPVDSAAGIESFSDDDNGESGH